MPAAPAAAAGGSCPESLQAASSTAEGTKTANTDTELDGQRKIRRVHMCSSLAHSPRQRAAPDGQDFLRTNTNVGSSTTSSLIKSSGMPG
jgi:hypothetical protein